MMCERFVNALCVCCECFVSVRFLIVPLTATGQYDVEVGRLRKSLVFGDKGIEFFVVGDQLLRGAALNAVLIAEVMAANGSIKAQVEV